MSCVWCELVFSSAVAPAGTGANDVFGDIERTPTQTDGGVASPLLRLSHCTAASAEVAAWLVARIIARARKAHGNVCLGNE